MIRSIVKSALRRVLRLLETAEPPEPKLNEAQRKTLAETEARQQIRIEPGAYARPKPQGLTQSDVDYLQDFKGGQKLLTRLSSAKRGRNDK